MVMVMFLILYGLYQVYGNSTVFALYATTWQKVPPALHQPFYPLPSANSLISFFFSVLLFKDFYFFVLDILFYFSLYSM
jgi:hypothetical protein